MPELPDVTIYIETIAARVVGQPLEGIRLASPFLLRSVDPPPAAFTGRPVVALRRLGKRVVFAFADDLFAVVHLMIAGRFRWGKRGAKPPARLGLAAFDFPTGTLLLTEASRKKRAALYLVRGAAALAVHDPGGLEVLTASPAQFAAALRSESHTLKRALTDPHLFSGIGNAYSDEILHAARLSPVQLTRTLSDAEVARLHAAAQATLQRWIDALRAQFAGRVPGAGEVTAFRPGFAVHGRYGKPCPQCGNPVQRIRYADNETNYCPTCQTSGRLLADRSLSRLLKADWPKTLEELEAFTDRRRQR
jgi:formamidopyrimidine-DNA glycosylase